MSPEDPGDPAAVGRARHHDLRSLLLGVVCGLGAVLAHGWSSPGPVGVLTPAVVAVAGLAAAPVLLRRPSLPRLVVGAVGLQLLGHATMATGGTGSSHAHAMPGSSVPPALQMLLDGGLPMLVAHLAVALATALLARSADTALVAILRGWVAALLLRAPAPLPTLPSPRPRPPAPRRPLSCAHGASAGPRAPPASLRLRPVPP